MVLDKWQTKRMDNGVTSPETKAKADEASPPKGGRGFGIAAAIPGPLVAGVAVLFSPAAATLLAGPIGFTVVAAVFTTVPVAVGLAGLTGFAGAVAGVAAAGGLTGLAAAGAAVAGAAAVATAVISNHSKKYNPRKAAAYTLAGAAFSAVVSGTALDMTQPFPAEKSAPSSTLHIESPRGNLRSVFKPMNDPTTIVDENSKTTYRLTAPKGFTPD